MLCIIVIMVVTTSSFSSAFHFYHRSIMPMPALFIGAELFFTPPLSTLPTEEVQESFPFHATPIFGVKWDRVLLSTSIQTKHEYRHLLLGDTEYESQIGITEFGFELRPTCFQKEKNVVFVNLGVHSQIPTVHISSNTQDSEDTTLITEQYMIDLTTIRGSLGFGVRKEFSGFFIETQIRQNLTWNPIFSDEFGTENHFILKSDGSVTFGWLI